MNEIEDTHVVGAGTIVGERYRILERLGQGGVGTVYRVEHTHMAKTMAMKLLRPEVSAIPDVQERFEREAQSAARLDDPRIVRVTDFGKNHDGGLFLVMELVDGRTLSSRLADRVSVDEALHITDELLAALEHAHGQNVIHRDLKPDNVMLLEKNGVTRVKVLDFGLAKITEGGADQPLTKAGMVFGTPRYMSPEQAAAEPADHRADLYAVGVILYEALSGKPPFTGASAVDVLRAHLTKDPPPLEDLPVATERAQLLRKIVSKALAKQPKDRFASATEFRAALAETTTVTAARRAEDTALSRPPPRPVTPAPSTTTTSPRPMSTSEAIIPRTNRRPLAAVAVALTIMLVLLAMMEGGGPEAVEAALDRGDVAAARTEVTKLEQTHPDDPTTFLAVGHVALAEKDPDAAHRAFARALALDNDIASEIRFSDALLALAKEGQPPSAEVIRDISAEGGLGSVPFLAEAFRVSKSSGVRRRAYAGLERLESTDAVPEALALLLKDLEDVRATDCEIRRWYVRRLVKFDSPRVRTAIERESKRSGPLPFISVNDCMARELRDYLEPRGKRE